MGAEGSQTAPGGARTANAAMDRAKANSAVAMLTRKARGRARVNRDSTKFVCDFVCHGDMDGDVCGKVRRHPYRSM
jgi:hypothetical protein